MEIEARARDLGVPVEVLQPAHLGPGRVDTERDDRQQQIGNPDAEILTDPAGESELFGCARRGSRRWRGCRRGRNARRGVGHGLEAPLWFLVVWLEAGCRA